MIFKNLVASAALLAVSPLLSASDFDVRRSGAEGGVPSATQLNGKLARAVAEPVYNDKQTPRYDFDFKAVNAWLNAKGEWFVSGQLRHTRALCATYYMGLRFGKGTNGCFNVEWLSEPVYGPGVRHCNEAVLTHTGGGNLNNIDKARFAEITCARLEVRCEGQCDK